MSEQNGDPQTGDAPPDDAAAGDAQAGAGDAQTGAGDAQTGSGDAQVGHDPFAPDGAPWAMQLAVRDDRQARPGHLAVCAAAGTAVVRLLADPRAVDGPWTPYVRRWVDGRIRKVVRRGRGAQFAATGALDHVEVIRGDVVVRAFVPGPTDAVPRELAKLQVGGTDMPRDGDAWPSDDEPLLLTVALNPAVPMTTGKAAAQTGHAAQLAWMALQPRELAAIRQAWLEQEFAVRVVIPGEAHWRRLLRAAPVAVHDGGFTEVAPGTLTAIACWQD